MCTRIFWNDNAVAKTVSRCMDWAVSDEPELWFVPRGTERRGGPDEEALRWTSRYSSVVTSMWGVGTVDGMNERGFAAHALYLDPEDVSFPEPDGRPTLANAPVDAVPAGLLRHGRRGRGRPRPRAHHLAAVPRPGDRACTSP